MVFDRVTGVVSHMTRDSGHGDGVVYPRARQEGFEAFGESGIATQVD